MTSMNCTYQSWMASWNGSDGLDRLNKTFRFERIWPIITDSILNSFLIEMFMTAIINNIKPYRLIVWLMNQFTQEVPQKHGSIMFYLLNPVSEWVIKFNSILGTVLCPAFVAMSKAIIIKMLSKLLISCGSSSKFSKDKWIKCMTFPEKLLPHDKFHDINKRKIILTFKL